MEYTFQIPTVLAINTAVADIKALQVLAELSDKYILIPAREILNVAHFSTRNVFQSMTTAE